MHGYDDVSLKQLFGAMLLNSKIAKYFKISKTKLSYILFSLAEYFPNNPINLAKQSPFFSLLFDKSHNQILNKLQMDLQIRFYDNTTGEAWSRYLDSRLVYQPNAVNLADNMTNSTKNLDSAKMLIEIDGPNVNWPIFDKRNGELEKQTIWDWYACQWRGNS